MHNLAEAMCQIHILQAFDEFHSLLAQLFSNTSTGVPSMKDFLELLRVILENNLSVSATKVKGLLSSLVPFLGSVSDLEVTETLNHLLLFNAKGF